MALDAPESGWKNARTADGANPGQHQPSVGTDAGFWLIVTDYIAV